MVKRLFILCLFLGLVSGCGSSSLKLMSQVVNQEDKTKPIEGARVQVLDETGTVIAETTTGADGTFQLEIPQIDKSKSYEMVVQKELVSEVARKPLNVAAKNPAPSQVALPVRGAIKGMVYEAGKNPNDVDSRLVAAAISVMRGDLVITETTTGNNGVFTVGQLNHAKYKFRVDHPQYYPSETTPWDVETGEITPVEIKVERIPEGDVNRYRELKNAGDWKPVQIAPAGGGSVFQ